MRKIPGTSLADSEVRYRTLFEKALNPIMIVDENYRYIDANTSALNFLECTREALIGKEVWDFSPPAFLEKQKREHADFLSGRCLETEYLVNGRIKILLLNIVPVKISGKLMLYGIGQDITEQKRIQEALCESEERLQSIVDNCKAVVHLKDLQSKYLLVNREWERIVGLDRKDIIGKSIYEVFPKEIADVLWGHDLLVLDGKTPLEFDENVPQTDGLHTYVSLKFPLYDSQGSCYGVCGISTDITERKRAEEELRRKQEQLLQAQKMEAIGKLACGVAHDFNNLLTTIHLQVEMLMTKIEQASPFYERLKQIRHTVTRGGDLTSQLLLFGRKEAAKMESIKLNQTVTDLSKMLGRFVGEDHPIKFHLQPDLWMIQADRGNIERVIMNLVINARDAMPHGGQITLKTENLDLLRNDCQSIPNARRGKWVCVSVTDAGIGIDKEDLQHVFEPFFSTKETGKGTGLGLSIVQCIVEQHRGWVNVDSTPGEGTTFKVYLPAFPIPEHEQRDEPNQPSFLRGRGERILLVEDEEALRLFAKAALSAHGYQVFDASDAPEAFAILEREKERIDLLFSDVIMPGKSGIQLAEEILLNNPEVRILLSSGYTDEKSQCQLIQEKEFGFLRKPYSLAELLRKTRQVIEGTDTKEE